MRGRDGNEDELAIEAEFAGDRRARRGRGCRYLPYSPYTSSVRYSMEWALGLPGSRDRGSRNRRGGAVCEAHR